MYLHGFIDEELYMQPPIGYTKVQPGQVCKLQRSLYGFKQDGRQWNKELTLKLNSYGFQQSMHDNYLFVKVQHMISWDYLYTSMIPYYQW